MNDVDLTRLKLARERVAPEHHHHDEIARAVEYWWGVSNGDAIIKAYGLKAVQDAHETMQGFSPDKLDSIRNLGGYFRRMCTDTSKSTAVPLARTLPKLKADIASGIAEQEAVQRRTERRRIAENTPGTLEYRIKNGG